MRFSPVLLAVVAASTTLGLAYPANAEATNLEQTADDGSETTAETTITDFVEAGVGTQLTLDELSGSFGAERQADNPTAIEFAGWADDAAMDSFAQVPPSENPGNVPLDAPAPQVPSGSETPTEETPNQLQFQLDGSPDLDIPTDLDIPEDAPEDAESDIPETEPPEPIAPAVPESDAPAAPSTPTTPTTPPATEQPDTEPRVLVSEVLVVGAEGDLQNEVYRVIQTQPGRATTRSQLQEDINAIFATGFFSSVRAVPEDTPLGVRVTFDVAPNPVLESVQLSGNALETIVYNEAEVPLQTAVDDIFSPQYGQILNLRDLQVGVEQLNQLYQDNGYVLAQVVGAPQISPDGVVTLEVAEGVIEDIQIRFLNRDGEAEDDEGEPIRGRTRDFIITREFESQPGEVFNQQQIQADLQRAFALGIFEDLNISLNPGQDPRQVEVVVNVTERNTGSFAAGIGISSASGFFGTASFQEQNLGGNNQRLNAELQIGSRDLLFDISFTDPWIGGDPNRTSYTVNAFGRQSRSLVFEGDDDDIRLPNGDRPRVRRFGGGVTFGRPLDDGWRVSLGAQYQRISIRDLDGDLEPRSEFGTPLSFSDSGQDDLFTVQFSASRDQRNSPLQPTSGSFLRLSTEQSIPIGNGSIFLNRLRASYSYFLPVRFTNFTEGCRLDEPSPVDCPQTLAFNVQGGTILGDLPPYEAFSLGGTDSVRGYGAGELASGRSFLQATVEYRFPVFSIVSGALFADVGTDLGTGDDIPGNPSEILNKPGSGFGYGLGVRVQSPLGQIRVDYAINDEGDSQIHFGIGERF